MNFFADIEEKWQNKWEKTGIFHADLDTKRNKTFITFPFPYINGPLHVGHLFTAARVDAYARFKRMQGLNVLFPWAWHWTGQPLTGASQRVLEEDEEFIKVLKEVVGVPEEEIKRFVDPKYMAAYYTDVSRMAAKKAGFSVDWRREFITTAPSFMKFIEWQYEKLRMEGYVIKGTHPVVWCPRCMSPTGDHDRQEGEGVTPEKYSLIKFRLDEETGLPAATLRPETIYGVTNIWINPDAAYVLAKVDNEKWIISKEAVEKLREQGRTITIESKLKGGELVGKTVQNPINGSTLLILPGWFVDAAHATGIVYSVPAHAPYDWLALRDLQEDPEKLHSFNIKPEVIKKIHPISIIEVDEFGSYPAVEIVKQMKVRDQNDPNAEKATKALYKKEFHSGILKDNCMKHAGKTVREVKNILMEDFEREGIADIMYELPELVKCRCMTSCIVKVLQDQWFLKYSDPEWKKKVREAISKMEMFPETATHWFLAVVDWLNDWACARRTGLGTPLPWEKGWIIETLSDSTIYMAFYTINKYIKQHNIKPEKLTKEVFDYIFSSQGNLKDVASRTEISPEILKEMRREFLYWYPVDVRVSAKELVPNHLTFFIFHHVALFPQKHWPRAIGVNGMLMIGGKQMHKSKGNFITARKAIEEYGADATRCALILSAEGMDDPDWRKKNILDMKNKLETLFDFISKVNRNAEHNGITHLENWIMSRIQHHISSISQNLEEMRTRTAFEIALFEIWNDFRWYMNRSREPNAQILKEAAETWLKLLTPFAPHICEELWSRIGKKTLISITEWPQVAEHLKHLQAEEEENLLKEVIDDTQNILRATKISPKKIYYYTASSWKWKVQLNILRKFSQGEVRVKDVMTELSKDDGLKDKLDSVAKFASKTIDIMNKIPARNIERMLKTGKLNEERVIGDAKEFLSDRFQAKIVVFNEEQKVINDSKLRARLALPCRPSIYIE